MDIIRLRVERNQLIINALGNYIANDPDSMICGALKHGDKEQYFDCDDEAYLYDKLPCNKCQVFADYSKDKTTFITD